MKKILLVIIVIFSITFGTLLIHSSVKASNPVISYVIITSEVLNETSISHSRGLQTFKDLIDNKEMSATIITVQDIYSNSIYWANWYPDELNHDNNLGRCAKIRAFINYVVNNWSTEYILLGGDTNNVPVERLWDGPNSELWQIESDAYYSFYNGPFNSNGNSIFGEYPTIYNTGDGIEHGPIDYTKHIAIGRALVSTPKEVSFFVEKTIAYSLSQDESINNALFISGILDSSTLGKLWNDNLINNPIPILDSNHQYGYSLQTAYDDFGNYYDKTNLINDFNLGPNIVNSMSHGSWNGTYHTENGAFIFHVGVRPSVNDVGLLTNKFPFIWFIQACDCGNFDHWYRWVYGPPLMHYIWVPDSISENLIGHTPQGAAAIISYSCEPGYSLPGHYDDSASQAMAEFWNNIYINNMDIGNALAGTREYLSNLPGLEVITCYGLNLFGDPQLSIKLPISNHNPTTPTLQKIGENYYASSTDIDGNQISYKWKVDGQEYSLWTPYKDSGESIEYNGHFLFGTHHLQAKARDTNLAESDWSESVTLPISFDLTLDSVSQALINEEIQFNSFVVGDNQPSSWHYDFGDGAQSQQQNPSHAYNSYGTFNVTLSVQDQNNFYTNITKTISISPLISAFESSSKYILPNQEISFIDNSRGINRITNWTWNFDDGDYAYINNPTHTFNNNGIYNVSLTVRDNDLNSMTTYKKIFVDSSSPQIIELPANKIGYGSKATLRVAILDNISGTRNATINITSPTLGFRNSTLTTLGNNSFTTFFNDTWNIGIYNYTVWTLDNAGNSNTMMGNFIITHIIGNSFDEKQNISIGDTITGNKFILYHGKSVAENITVFIDSGNATINDHYQCVIYRHNDSKIIGVTEQKNITEGKGWILFNFTEPKPILSNNTEYFIGCWSDCINVTMYYENLTDEEMFYDDGTSTLQGHYFEGIYNVTPDPIRFKHEDKLYSVYLGYVPDTASPSITDVQVTPPTIGLGYNVTINATVTDSQSGIDNVSIDITYPDNSNQNTTMIHEENNQYSYVFTSGYEAGQYQFKIWARDRVMNGNDTSGSFAISGTATISASTLKDLYINRYEFLNLTDPPELPENYTLIGQGLTWNKYLAPNGDQTILETSVGPINYQNQTGAWNPVNQTIQTLDSTHPAYAYGYRAGNERGLYSTYFKPNLQDPWPIAFAYNRSQDPTIHTVQTRLIGVGYLDPASTWNYHILQNTQTSQAQLTGNTLIYPGVFTGTDLILSYGTQELKETLTLSNTTKAVLQSHPPSLYGLNDASSYLVLINKIKTQDLTLYNNTQTITNDLTLTNNSIDFKTILGDLKCAMPLGDAYELNNQSNHHTLTLRVIHTNGETYILAGLRLTDLNQMTYPVVIDPSITLYSSADDGYAYKSNTNYNGARTSQTGTIDASSTSISIGQRKQAAFPSAIYYVYRGYLFFNTSQIPTNAIIDTATLGLYKVSDSSTTDFDITIQNGQPTYPHSPLQTGDYDLLHYSGNGGSLNTNSFTTGYNNIALNTQGRGWINLAGWTKLCLRSSRDITPTTPTGDEYITITSNEFTGVGCQPRLVIAYRNQSKIKNTGTTDIKGYLLMQVQFHSGGSWVVDNEIINETSPRTILAGHQLGLDTIFNGRLHVSDLTHGDGTYRVYVALRDPDGNVLMIDTNHKLEATWQFTVDT